MQWLNFLKTILELKFQKAQLEEHCESMNIIILDLKYTKKTWKEHQKRLDWCRRHLNKYCHYIFFTDKTTVYFDDPLGKKNGWRKIKSILNTNNKRRGQKLNLWGAISANWKVTQQIFEENLNTEKYKRDIK